MELTKRQYNCIRNRIRWIDDILKELKKMYKKYDDGELQGIYEDISFNLYQIKYYVGGKNV